MQLEVSSENGDGCNTARSCTCAQALYSGGALWLRALFIHGRDDIAFGGWVHTGGDLTGAWELQHTVEGQIVILVCAGKLGPDDTRAGLE